MKNYEKFALLLGITGLGFVIYQTKMQKEAAQTNESSVVDTTRSVIVGGYNMIGGAVENGKNFVVDTLHRGTQGAEEVKNRVFSGASGLYQAGTNSVGYVSDTGQNGLKYIYDKGADTGNALREGGGWFFTKSKDAMGNTYETARAYVPDALSSIGGLTGIFHAPKKEKPIGQPTPPSENKTEDWMNQFMHPMG